VAAAYLLGGCVDEAGTAVELRTAGTHATPGQPVSSRTVAALAAVVGVPVALSDHRARQLDGADVAWADLVVAMEATQVRALRRTQPDVARRCATLGLLARELPPERRPLAGRVATLHLDERELDGADDVDDPAGGDDAAYERTMAVLVAWCGELARRLAG
jgi:protein-tyrosine-phosphatase